MANKSSASKQAPTKPRGKTVPKGQGPTKNTPKTPNTPRTTSKTNYPHVCNSNCRHTCGDAGGRTKAGKPCTRPGRWGLAGPKEHGRWGLCKSHDPDASPPRKQGLLGMDGLTPLQARFVIELCGRANGNLTEAARLAGYSGTRAALGVMGHTLYKQPRIRAAIEKRYEELSMPAQEVIKRFTDIARSSMADLVTVSGGGIPTLNLTPEVMERYGPLIKEIDTDNFGNVTKVKLHDPLVALRDLARIRRLFEEPAVNVNVQVTSLSDDELQEKLRQTRSRVSVYTPPPASPKVRNGNDAANS